MVKVQRLHKDAIVPRFATLGSAGYDLCTLEDIELTPGGRLLIPFGWAFEIPEGLVGLLFIRSSFSKKGLCLGNAVGVIDSDFRGELKALVHVDFLSSITEIPKGTPMVQLVIVPHINADVVEVTELRRTERGSGGWGSTDKGGRGNEA